MSWTDAMRCNFSASVWTIQTLALGSVFFSNAVIFNCVYESIKVYIVYLSRSAREMLNTALFTIQKFVLP